jgi:hypothetical protein
MSKQLRLTRQMLRTTLLFLHQQQQQEQMIWSHS